MIISKCNEPQFPLCAAYARGECRRYFEHHLRNTGTMPATAVRTEYTAYFFCYQEFFEAYAGVQSPRKTAEEVLELHISSA